MIPPSGRHLAGTIWSQVKRFIPQRDRKAFAGGLIELFEGADLADFDGSDPICKAAGKYQDIPDEDFDYRKHCL